MAKVFITGASGFVGKRLILNLLQQGHEIYALCRIKGTKIFPDNYSKLHYIWGDLRNPEIIKSIPNDIEAAYYLVHSMSEVVTNLTDTETHVVQEFLKSIQHTEIKQIIYLGGIINDEKQLSLHLKSRLQVEKTLKESSIPITILRASIIIGAGSASFEIIRDLCEKLPIMIAPKWVQTSSQPIAIADVLFYLSSVLLNPKCFDNTFDIGGPQILTFKELLLEYSKFRHLKTRIIDIPLLTPRLSSYWLVFITSVRLSLCMYLVESMKNSTIVKRNELQNIIPHKCLTYTEALELAFQNISQNEVISNWMDSWEVSELDPDIQHYIQVPKEGCLQDQQKIVIKDSKEATLARMWSIGGSKGYYSLDWAWHLRGLFDKLIGGVGLNRGRNHPTEIKVGDSIDFWRVLKADKSDCHLILLANMKLPGEAWLEFKIENEGDQFILLQTATFRPKGLLGRFYWYGLYFFHFIIFRRMAKAIAGYNTI